MQCVNVLICLPHVNANRNMYICTLELNTGFQKMHAIFGIKISIVRAFNAKAKLSSIECAYHSYISYSNDLFHCVYVCV